MTPFDTQLLSIASAPVRDLSVEYYGSVERVISLTNQSDLSLHVEEVAVHCPADAADAPFLAKVKLALVLGPHQASDVRVPISPTALYKTYTNILDVRVKFRVHDGVKIGKTEERTVKGLMSIIIDEPATALGQVFISFKQDEDRLLARTLAKIAKRTGFTPFLKAENPRPGEDTWEDIKNKLKASTAVLVIWTDYTTMGDGVKTEVEFCHANRIRDILLLGDDVDRPSLYDAKSNQEYLNFDRENPSTIFVQVMESLRADRIRIAK